MQRRFPELGEVGWASNLHITITVQRRVIGCPPRDMRRVTNPPCRGWRIVQEVIVVIPRTKGSQNLSEPSRAGIDQKQRRYPVLLFPAPKIGVAADSHDPPLPICGEAIGG